MAIGPGGLRGVNRALALAIGLVVVGLLAMCWEMRAALAQDWMLESNLSQRMGYNTNLLLNPDHEIAAFSSQTAPELKLTRSGPTSNVSLLGRFEFNEYFGHSNLNSQDQFARLNASKALSERSQLGFAGTFTRDTTLKSDEDPTGEFTEDSIRFIRWDADPSWQYLLTPIDRLSFDARYVQVEYDSAEKTDYQSYGPTLTYSHDLSELASVTASVDYSRFEPDDVVDRSQDSYGGLLGYEYHPSERFTIGGAAGLSYTVTHEEGQDDTGNLGYRFQFNMDYDIDEQTKANVSLSRDTEPSSEGRLRNRNRGTLGLSYQLTELTILALDADYINDQTTGSNSRVSQRVQVRPSIRWDITDDLTISANYQFRYKTFESSGSAIDNGAFITLRYALPDLHWSGF